MRVEIIEQKGYHFLWLNIKGAWQLWMWDVPNEVKDQKEIANEAFGNVLVAGYGLGVLQKLLVENPKVTSVTSIEKYFEVILACNKTFGKIYGDYHIADFFDYETIRNYDCVIGDIWEDIGPLGLEEYEKFKSKAEEFLKPGGKILAWGKDYMEWLLSKK